MPNAESPTKVCIRCGQDCSAKARAKDAQGNYVCADCIANAKKQPKPGPGPRVAAPARSASNDQGVLNTLIDQSLNEHRHGCPNCHAPMKQSQVLCIKCGFNKDRGKQVQTVVKKSVEEKGIDAPSRYGKSRRMNKLMELGGMAVMLIAVGAIGLMGVLFFMATGGEEIWMGAYFLTWLAFGGVLWLITVVSMFMDEAWKGIVGMFVGLYMLYWVWAESESPLLQMATVVNILGLVGAYFLLGKAGAG